MKFSWHLWWQSNTQLVKERADSTNMSDEEDGGAEHAESEQEPSGGEFLKILCGSEILKILSSVAIYMLVLLILVSGSLDPLFFYIPVINNDSKCLGLDNTLRIIVVVFRTFVDGVYVIFLWWRRHQSASKSRTQDDEKSLASKSHTQDNEKSYRRIVCWIVTILAIMPLPQVVVYAVSWRLLTVKLLKFIVLIQFVPRVYLTVPSYQSARKRFDGIINMILAAIFYLLMFILTSNVLGAFWYLRAIERYVDCWKKACKARSLCGVSSLYCSGSLSNNRYLDEFCQTPPPPNSSFFDYGIYLDAFKREILSMHTPFLNKLFYCFWRGLQSLSSLGQNLEPGTYVWDDIFAIFIVVSGLVLFALLIGNMQVYLQKEAASDADKQARRARMNKKVKKKRKEIMAKRTARMKKERNERMAQMNGELDTWIPFRSLPTHLRKKITSCEDENWLRTTDINLESFLNNVPQEFQQDIRQNLCKDLLAKVESFQKLDPTVKTELRKRAKAVLFQARSIIYSEGYPIYEIIHIVDGRVLAFNRDHNMSEGSSQPLSSILKTNGDSIGNALLNKLLESPDTNLPLATETVQALTNVEAFALSLEDIVEALTQCGQSSYKTNWANVFENTKKKVANIKKKIFA